jgi:hypothetical protein
MISAQAITNGGQEVWGIPTVMLVLFTKLMSVITNAKI